MTQALPYTLIIPKPGDDASVPLKENVFIEGLQAIVPAGVQVLVHVQYCREARYTAEGDWQYLIRSASGDYWVRRQSDHWTTDGVPQE